MKTNNFIKKWAKDNMNRRPTKENIQIANKNMKICFTLYTIREMQIKTTRYHYTLIRIANIGTLTTPNTGEDMEQQELSYNAGGNAKWYSHFDRVWWFLTNIFLPYNPEIPLLGLPKGVEKLY